MRINKQTLSTVLFQYGILTFILVLEHFQQEEEYEVCSLMIQAIEENNKYRRTQLQTTLSDDVVDSVIKSYSDFGCILTRIQCIEKHQNYADHVIEELGKLIDVPVLK